VVGTVTGIDIDTGDTKSYSLTGTAGGRFAINSSTGVITVANDSLLNYEAATSHTVTVRVTDSSGTIYHETFTINVTNVNEALTDVSLSATTVVEKATNGTVVGNVTGTDPDAGDTHTYQLMDTAGGRFAINSSTGVITVADSSLLNYEAAPSHSVTVRVTDAGGLTRDQTFTITLANVNEDPATFTGGSISLQQKAIQTEDRRLQSEGLRPPNVETVESKNIAYPTYPQEEIGNGIPHDGTRSDVSKEPPSFSPAQIIAVTRFLDEMASSEGPAPIHEMLDRHFDEVKQLLQTAENEALPDPGILRNQPDHLPTVLSAWLIANGVNLVPTRKPLVRARQLEGEKPASLENDGRQSF
jgi:VCBS repeat-containing protein